MAEENYLHGSSREEQQRLALMNDILNQRCLQVVGPLPGERVLELGAGTGIFAKALALEVTQGPGGAVVGIERDENQLATAQQLTTDQDGLEIRQGDVYDPPLNADEWGSFDVVHARFLLEHLERPADAVDVMLRAARPGGRLVLIDDDHALMLFDPDPGAMPALFTDYAEQFERLGHRPFVGRRLASLLHNAGAQVVETTQINFGASASEPGFWAVAENLAAVVIGARSQILASSSWSEAGFDAAIAEFRSWSERPDATIWYTLPAAVARRPET